MKYDLKKDSWAEVLRRMYHDEHNTLHQIADTLDVCVSTVLHAMEHHGIERRLTSQTRKTLERQETLIALMTEDHAEKLRHLYDTMTMDEIAASLKVDLNILRKAMDHHGIKRKTGPRGPREPNKNIPADEFKRLYEDDITIADLAAHYDMSASTILYQAKKLNFKMRGRGYKNDRQMRRYRTRNMKIIEARKRGVRVTDLAREHNLSRARIYMILDKHQQKQPIEDSKK